MTNIVTSNTANLPTLLLLTERLRPLWTDSVGPDILSPHASLSRALLLLLKLLHYNYFKHGSGLCCSTLIQKSHSLRQRSLSFLPLLRALDHKKTLPSPPSALIMAASLCLTRAILQAELLIFKMLLCRPVIRVGLHLLPTLG